MTLATEVLDQQKGWARAFPWVMKARRRSSRCASEAKSTMRNRG